MGKWIYTVLLFAVLCAVTACGNGKREQNADKKPETSIVPSEQPDEGLEEAKQPDAGSEEVKEAETEAALNSEAQTEIPSEESVQEDAQQAETEMEMQEETEMKMEIQVGDTIFTATLAENSSVDALKELMADGPLTLNMSDYASMEKGVDLGVKLPQNNEPMNTQAGDIILYQGRTLAIYYDTNSWSLTPIAKIDNVDAEELRKVLGSGDVTVTLSIE